MALKIDASTSATAYHIIDGAVVFPYAIDAHHAVSQHPDEWSAEPWSAADVAAARKEAGAPDVEWSPEEKAAFDEHEKAVAEANERLTKFRADMEEKRKLDEQVAADEALVKSAPPMPDPNKPKRPFGRPGDPTPAELEQMRKRDEKKANEERIAAEKKAADDQAASGAKITQ